MRASCVTVGAVGGETSLIACAGRAGMSLPPRRSRIVSHRNAWQAAAKREGNMTQKVALVTGSARGIGLATTAKFLEDGWKVIRVDWDAPALEASAEGLGDVHDIVADISLEADVNDLVASVTELTGGGINALVNNAGIADFGPMEDTDFARWRRIMSINLDGTFLMSQGFIPLLKARKGAIVNIASISALRASTLRVAYGTSKAAVAHLTEQQAAELGEFGVRANCVAPGPVRTKLAMAVHTP